jgi:hypothetical protein
MMIRNGHGEEIRIILEGIKAVLLLAGISVMMFTALQWRTSNHLTKENMRITAGNVWRSHAELFAERPYLRAYFYEASNIESEDANVSEILAVADLRLEAMNAILTDAYRREVQEDMVEWVNTFTDAFRNSPVLCARVKETAPQYGLIVPVADKGCS